MMRDTVFCRIGDNADSSAVAAAVGRRVAKVQSCVPGFRLVSGPQFDGDRVATFLEVEGVGDYATALCRQPRHHDGSGHQGR
jgi:acetaldehyde dehydrogenase (acetylating)